MTWHALLSKGWWGFGSIRAELYKFETSRLQNLCHPKGYDGLQCNQMNPPIPVVGFARFYGVVAAIPSCRLLHVVVAWCCCCYWMHLWYVAHEGSLACLFCFQMFLLHGALLFWLLPHVLLEAWEWPSVFVCDDWVNSWASSVFVSILSLVSACYGLLCLPSVSAPSLG